MLFAPRIARRGPPSLRPRPSPNRGRPKALTPEVSSPIEDAALNAKTLAEYTPSPEESAALSFDEINENYSVRDTIPSMPPLPPAQPKDED